MADAFQIDWVERMKTDPKANSILNNKIHFNHFSSWYFRRLPVVGSFRGTRGTRVDVKQRKNRLLSDRYTKHFDHMAKAEPGRYRWNTINDRTTYENNPNKYWDNTLAGSIYNKPSIPNSPNPHIEKLSYNSI